MKRLRSLSLTHCTGLPPFTSLSLHVQPYPSISPAQNQNTAKQGQQRSSRVDQLLSSHTRTTFTCANTTRTHGHTLARTHTRVSTCTNAHTTHTHTSHTPNTTTTHTHTCTYTHTTHTHTHPTHIHTHTHTHTHTNHSTHTRHPWSVRAAFVS